jgi:hypothetical protein
MASDCSLTGNYWDNHMDNMACPKQEEVEVLGSPSDVLLQRPFL